MGTHYQPDLPWRPPLAAVPDLCDELRHVRMRCHVADRRAIYNEDDGRKHRGWAQGGKFYLRCCFHRERTPSLVVYPAKFSRGAWPHAPHFHCYGCGAGGPLEELLDTLNQPFDFDLGYKPPSLDWEKEFANLQHEYSDHDLPDEKGTDLQQGIRAAVHAHRRQQETRSHVYLAMRRAEV